MKKMCISALPACSELRCPPAKCPANITIQKMSGEITSITFQPARVSVRRVAHAEVPARSGRCPVDCQVHLRVFITTVLVVRSQGSRDRES